MKIVVLIILFIMIGINLYCFAKSRKYLNKVKGNDEESNKNYEQGLKYIKISVVISFLICLFGSAAVLIFKFLK